MNTLDRQYTTLLQDILENGTRKQTRNGETLSVFGRQIRHSMKDGFPLLTTKKMAFKTMVTELLWFLRGDTNIKFLVDNDCHIWVGDSYQAYLKSREKTQKDYKEKWGDDISNNPLSKEKFINKIKTDAEFAKKWGELGKVYGHQWRSWAERRHDSIDNEYFIGIDQIANLINKLKNNPDDRRMIVTAWNPSEVESCVLPPCHYTFQVYTRELSLKERLEHFEEFFDCTPNSENMSEVEIHNELSKSNIPIRAISLMFNMRSNDVPLGLPFNIASYALLLEIIAKMVNMVPDELIGNLGDCHIYSNQIDGVKEQIGREPYPLPKLNINTEFWPTENCSCGEGPIDAYGVLEGFSKDDFCKCLMEEDIQLYNYQCHPAIKMPLSN